MPFEEPETTGAQLLQRQRCEVLAAQIAEKIAAAEDCLFSLLPKEELARQVGDWYEASSQAMLRGNYAPMDAWIRRQACLAAEQGFELRDLLKLLRICRGSAIELERWNEDFFSLVDEVINEGLTAIRPTVAWTIPVGLNYLSGRAEQPQTTPQEEAAAEPIAEQREGERRAFGRNRLQLPIRICGATSHGWLEEITHSQNVSRSGLYFVTRINYEADMALRLTYPYWKEPGSMNWEYPAKVVRLVSLPERTWGVALEFARGRGHKAD